MGAFEMMRQVNRHRDCGHCWQRLALSVHDLDGVLQVGDTDLVDRNPPGVPRLLDVGEGLVLFAS